MLDATTNLTNGTTTVPEADWSIATAEQGELPLVFRIRSKPANIEPTDYPFLVLVSWSFQPENESGMPSDHDQATMGVFEDSLTTALEGSHQAVLMLVATGNGVREWQWYARSSEATMKLVNKALRGQPRYPIQFAVEEDPNWEAYRPFNVE